jgi:hypothetical protein
MGPPKLGRKKHSKKSSAHYQEVDYDSEIFPERPQDQSQTGHDQQKRPQVSQRPKVRWLYYVHLDHDPEQSRRDQRQRKKERNSSLHFDAFTGSMTEARLAMKEYRFLAYFYRLG